MVEQRLIFGRVAMAYDDTRAAYPDELIDDIVSYGGLHPGDRVLEVGGGTGIATRAFAARGLAVHVLEPSEEMAAVLRARSADTADTADTAAVTVETRNFEDWRAGGPPYHVVAAGQSWHWVDGAVRYVRAREALAVGGTVALFGHRPRPDGEVGQLIGAAYRRFVPEQTRRPYHGGDIYAPEFADELAACGLFESVEAHHYEFRLTLDTERLLRWFSTMSDHQLLPDDDREALHAEIADIVTDHGGSAEVAYRTALYLARAR